MGISSHAAANEDPVLPCKPCPVLETVRQHALHDFKIRNPEAPSVFHDAGNAPFVFFHGKHLPLPGQAGRLDADRPASGAKIPDHAALPDPEKAQTGCPDRQLGDQSFFLADFGVVQPERTAAFRREIAPRAVSYVARSRSVVSVLCPLQNHDF